MYSFILILFALLILLILGKSNENYDGRIKQIDTIEKCADIASSLYDVSAFGYDNTGNCYVSKTSLSRPPIQIHPYHNDFKITDIICNKLNYIRNNDDLRDKNNVISNRLYMCYLNDSKLRDDNYELIYFQKNIKAKKINREDISKLPYDKENMFKIDWAKNMEELNDIVYSNNTITWDPAVYSPDKVYDPYEAYIERTNAGGKCLST